jgi:tetratricopeptide (TPR) repeat protein
MHSNYGVMLHLAGDNREAVKQFQLALGENPDLTSANLFAGLSELDLGEPGSALPYLKKAQQLDSTRPAPLLALGKVYVALSDYHRANEAYAKAAALDSHLAEAWYGLGVTDRSLAEEMLNQAARSGRMNDESATRSAHRLLAAALNALNRAIQLEPNSARTHLLMAESLSDAGKLVEAVAEYHAALKLDPDLDAAYLGLASAYWKRRQFDDTLPLLKRVLQNSPKDAEANGMMADILEHNGDLVGAQRYAEIALAGNPHLIETRVVLARVYLAKQQPKLAIGELRQVISADPDGSYHFLLYRAYRDAGDEREAQQAMAEFRRLRYGARKE